MRGTARSLEQARAVASKLFDGSPRPTAIVASHDLLATACYHEAEVRGLAIGTDLCGVGFDDSLAATILRPQLSSVSQPLELVGKEIIRLVAELLRGSPVLKPRVLLKPTLVVRESSSKPRSAD